jgi:hypothetical protein
MGVELVYGANFKCVLHHFSSLTRLKGSWGQLGPKTDPKQPKRDTKMIIFPEAHMPLRRWFHYDHRRAYSGRSWASGRSILVIGRLQLA